jgi:hypothetical protein
VSETRSWNAPRQGGGRRRETVEFARAYVNRSGRIDDERLAKMSPRFAALCASEHQDRA